MRLITRWNRWPSLVPLVFGFLVAGPYLLADDPPAKPADAVPQPVVEAVEGKTDQPDTAEKPGVTEVGVKIDLKGLFQGLLGGGEQQPRGAANVPPDAPQKGIEEQQPDPDNDPQVMQFTQMNRYKLTSELRFVRLVCGDLTPEQRPKIHSAAEASLKQFAINMVKGQRQLNGRGMINPWNTDAGEFIREGLTKALKETLSEEQMTRYSHELQQRREVQKRAVILNVISMLDGRLFLTAEQREKIEGSLKAQWQDRWERWNMVGMYGGQYLPQIPDPCVTPHLNGEQKKVWSGLMKVEFGWWNNDDPRGNQDDEQWWGAVPKDGQANAVNAPQGGVVIFAN